MASPKAIKKSEINLHDLGFDPAAPVPDRIAKLRALRGKTANIDLAIAKALGDISDLAAGEMLVEMEADATGALRREIRRAIYKLRQHDVEVREPEATTKPTAPATASEAGLTAFMSPIDAEGAQIIWMVKARARGGIVRLWGLVSETSGLVGLQNHALTRRELKSQHEELEKQAGIKLVEIDPQLADFILCDA
ncbi:MAG TPA: hypothetical protein VN867_04455, partial [Candidatus Binataceae bacterium]|nr:hypothetical protein [Candidatus Binataceae bacterium]